MICGHNYSNSDIRDQVKKLCGKFNDEYKQNNFNSLVDAAKLFDEYNKSSQNSSNEAKLAD